MPNEILLKTGTPIVLADTTDYSPTAGNNLGTRTDQIDLTSLGAGSYRQSAKFDFGATRAGLYSVRMALEYATAPAAGELASVYIGYSSSGTGGTDNPANLSGSDAAYAGYSSNADDAIKQLDLIGSLILTVQATTTVQAGHVGMFVPKERYGIIVVKNASAADALHSDAVEMAVRLAPVVTEVQ